MKKWKEGVETEEYKNLSTEERVEARDQYFNNIVAPQVPAEDVDLARKQFLDYTEKIKSPKEKSGDMIAEFGKNLLSNTSRIAGYGFGTLNAPLAFVWGAGVVKDVGKEEFENLPGWKKQIAQTKSAFGSAWDSISKKGEWGTMYGDYYKAVRGQDIVDDLPDNVKWAAPSVEFLANTISDPLLVTSLAGSFSRLKFPPSTWRNLPPQAVSDIKRIRQLPQGQKTQVFEKLKQAVSDRKNYSKWFDDMLGKTKSVKSKQPQKGTLEKVLELGYNEQNRSTMSLFKNKSKEGQIISVLEDRFGNKIVAAKGLLKRAEKLEKLGQTEKALKFREASAGEWSSVLDEASKFLSIRDKFVSGRVKKMLGKGFEKLGETPELVANPSWAKVRGMLGKVEKNTFSMPEVLSKLNIKLFDRLSPLKSVSKKGYDEARVFSAYKDIAAFKFRDLVDNFGKVKEHEVLFRDYVSAHRAMDRARRGIKNPNNVTLVESKKAISEIEKYFADIGGNANDLRTTLGNFQKWTHDNILIDLVDSGVISRKSYNGIVKNNQWYAAFDVIEKLPPDLNRIPHLPSKEYFSLANQKVVKALSGTEKKIADPIESTVTKFMKAQELVARNNVANAIIDEALPNGLVRPVANSLKELATMKKAGLNPLLKDTWNTKEFGTIGRFRDGNVEKFVMPINIAEAAKQLSSKQAPRVIQALNNIFRKTATTLYLPFTISNAFRDGLLAYTSAPVFKATRPDKFATRWLQGFAKAAKFETLGADDMVESYFKSGGGFGYVGDLRQSSQAKKLLFKKGLIDKTSDIVTSPVKLIEKISSTVELAPRLGIFKEATIKGYNPKDAALMARQSTIDFSKGGTLTKALNQWVPFLNARVQSKVTLAKALKENPSGTLSKIFTSVIVPASGGYAWNRLYYSDLYDDIPQQIRNNYFVTIIGTEEKDGKTKPKYVVIPKGDVGQLAWNPIESALDEMMGKNPETTTAVLTDWLSDVSPVQFARKGKVDVSLAVGSLTPPVIKGAVEDWANLKLYSGAEIVPYYQKNTKPPELQYRDNTPETYKWLGKKLKIAPLRLQNFAGNIFAGYGREGLDPTAMYRGLTGRLLKTTSGDIQSRAWVSVKDMEQGYNYTRAFADELVKVGKRDEAVALLNEWNENLPKRIKEFNKEFEKYGVKEQGGLLRSYRFNRQRRKNILRRVEKRGTALERKLRRK